MKKVFYLMFLALVPMCFTSCGDDDESNGISASMEGVWYLKSEKWYDWKKGQADTSKDPEEIVYEDYSKNIWQISKTGNNYSIIVLRSGSVRDVWTQIGNNEFRNGEGTGRDRVIIKSVLEKTMTIELYDGYYGEGNETGKTSEYGVLSFIR